MLALMPRAALASEKDDALVRVLGASIETLKAENEILKRRLATAEARAAQKPQGGRGDRRAQALMQIRTRAAALGDGGSRDNRC